MNFILSHTVYNDLQLSKIYCKPLNKEFKLCMKMLNPPDFKVFCEGKYQCIINNKVNVNGVKIKHVGNRTIFESSGNRKFRITP